MLFFCLKHLKISFFQVPFIEHDGVVLRESMAILRYVTKVFDVPDHWYPKDLMGEQSVNEYLHWQHLTTRLSCAMYFQVEFPIQVKTFKTNL